MERQSVWLQRICWAVLLSLASTAGACATSDGRGPEFDPRQPRPGVGADAGSWRLHERESGAAAEPSEKYTELIEDVYRGDVDLDEIGGRIDAALEEHPDRAELHEIAALMALVNGQRHAFWRHTMEAMTDTGTPLARLHLWMLEDRDLVRAQRDQFMRLLRGLRSDHPDPDLRAYATWELASKLRYHGEFERSREVADTLGWMADWQYLGPLDGGSDPLETTLPPEQKLDVDKSYEGSRGETSFRKLPSLDARREVALDSLVSPRDDKVAYLVTWVKVDRDRTVDVRFTADSRLQLFVNGTSVATVHDFEGRAFDNAIVRTPLEQGWNRLMVKTVGGDSWQVGVRLTTPEGEPLGDSVTTSAEPRDIEAGSVDASEVETLRTPVDLSAVEPRARRLFWRGRQAARTGPYEREEKLGGDYLDLASKNPLALYFAHLSWPGDFPEAEHHEQIAALLSESEQGGSGLLVQRGQRRDDEAEDRAALSDFRRAVDRTPGNRIAWVWLSYMQDAFGWEIERCETLRQTLDRWNSGWVRYQLADCYRDRGLKGRALEQFQRALALRPGRSGDLEELRELARDRADFDLAAHYGERLIEGYPVITYHRFQLAEIEMARKNYGRAESLYRNIIEQRPGWSGPYTKMGELALIRGRRGEAKKWFQRAADRDPEDDELKTRLAYHRTLAGERGGFATGTRVIDPGDLIDRRDSSKPVELGAFERWIPADSKLREAVEAGDEIEPPEGARWMMLFDEDVTRIHDDGTAKRVITQVRRAVTDKGRDELLRYYLPGKGKVEILKAHTVTPDGKRLEARSIRNDEIRFREVEKGASTVVQYIHHYEPHRVMDEDFFTSWWFQQAWAYTRHARWVVVSPEHEDLGFELVGDATSHRVETVSGREVHIFEAGDVPPARPEQNAIEARKAVDHAFLTTLDEWDTYVEWEMDRLPDSLDTSDALAERAATLTEDAESKRAKLMALAHWVQQEVRYEQDYEDRIARLIPHSATKVLDRQYGDCKDKAVLFIQMAAELDIDVDYALLRTRDAGTIVRELPGLYFNHAIAYVPSQEGLEEGFFVDLTGDMTAPGLLPTQTQGNTALVIDPDDGEHAFREIPYARPADQYETDTIEVKVESADEIPATWKLEARGPSAARIRSATDRISPERLGRGVFNRFFPGSSYSGVDVANLEDRREPVRLTFDGQLAGALRKSGGEHVLALPRIYQLHRFTSLESRRMPLDLGARQRNDMTVKFELGSGVQIDSVPDAASVEDPCLSFQRDAERDGRTVSISMSYEVRCATVQPDQYESFRSAAREAAQYSEMSVQLSFDGD